MIKKNLKIFSEHRKTKSEKPTVFKTIIIFEKFYCFPKFQENSLKIEWEITKNPQKFRVEICCECYQIITIELL